MKLATGFPTGGLMIVACIYHARLWKWCLEDFKVMTLTFWGHVTSRAH